MYVKDIVLLIVLMNQNVLKHAHNIKFEILLS
jgi:hypothetical protein